MHSLISGTSSSFSCSKSSKCISYLTLYCSLIRENIFVILFYFYSHVSLTLFVALSSHVTSARKWFYFFFYSLAELCHMKCSSSSFSHPFFRFTPFFNMVKEKRWCKKCECKRSIEECIICSLQFFQHEFILGCFCFF